METKLKSRQSHLTVTLTRGIALPCSNDNATCEPKDLTILEATIFSRLGQEIQNCCLLCYNSKTLLKIFQ